MESSANSEAGGASSSAPTAAGQQQQQQPSHKSSILAPPSPSQIATAHLAFNEDLCKLLKEICGVCGTSKKLVAVKAPPEAWLPLLEAESAKLHERLAALSATEPSSAEDCCPRLEASEVSLVDLATYLEKTVFLAQHEGARLKKLGREVAHLLVLRSLGVLQREVTAMVLGSTCGATIAAVDGAPAGSASDDYTNSSIAGLDATMSAPESPLRAGSEEAARQQSLLMAASAPSPGAADSVAAAASAAQLASSAPSNESHLHPEPQQSHPLPVATSTSTELRRAVVSDAIQCIGDCFVSLLQYLPPSSCDDATVRSIVRLCTEAIKAIDRTLFTTQCALLHVVAKTLEAQWSSSVGHEPSEAQIRDMIERQSYSLIEQVGVVECMQLRTMHELCNAPIEYLIAVVSVAQVGSNPSSLTAKTQASTKAVLFQVMGVLMHLTLPQSTAVVNAIEARWLRFASIASVYSICDPVLFTAIAALSRHCGDQNAGSLLAVKLLTDSVATLAVDDPTSLRCFLGSPAYGKDILVALLTCCVSIHPSVLGAGLSALRHLLLEATTEIAQEAGFIYCNCLIRLLDSENTSPDNKMTIVRHFNDAMAATHRSVSPAIDGLHTRHSKYLLFELFWLYDLNIRMHHANLVQHIVSTLSRMVRVAGAAEFALPPPPPGSSGSGSSPSNGGSGGAAAAGGQDGSAASSSVGGQQLNLELPSTLPVAALNVLVTMLETLAAAIAETNTTIDEHADHHADVRRVKRRRDEKVRVQRMVDIINTTPVKGIAKLLGIDHKLLLRVPRADDSLSSVFSDDSDGSPTVTVATTAIDGSGAAPPASGDAASFEIPSLSEQDEKKLIINEYKDVPPTLDKNIPMLEGIADFLLHTPSLNPGAVGEFLSEPKVLPLQCCKIFMSKLKFHGKSVTAALGEMLSVLQLPKEGQRIERILEFFARAYYDANANHEGISNTLLFPFKNVDACFVVVVATVMLNTDLHNPRVSSKMTLQSFTAQLRGCNDNGNFPDGFAESIFESISRRPLSNAKGIGASGQEGSGAAGSGGGGGAGMMGSAPEGRMDLLFFSREERKELLFGIERQRILSETRESIVRRSKRESIGGMPGVAQLARELFVSIWPTVHVVFGLALQHNAANVAPAVQLKCVKGLQCCLLAAAAFGFPMEGEVTLNALLKIAQGGGPGGDAAYRAILAVAASRFGKNLSESAWCSIATLLAAITRGSISGLNAEAEALYNSMTAVRRDSVGKLNCDIFDKIISAAFMSCFTVPCNDSATLGGNLVVVKRLLLPLSATASSYRRSGSSSNLLAAAAAAAASATGSSSANSFPAMSPNVGDGGNGPFPATGANEAASVLRAFARVVQKSIPKLSGIHQASSDCVHMILDLFTAITQFLVAAGHFMLPTPPPPARAASVCSALLAAFNVTDNPTVQLHAVQCAKTIASAVIPTATSPIFSSPGASSLSHSTLHGGASDPYAAAAVGLLCALTDLFKIVGLALTAPSARSELAAAGVLALGDFVELCMRQRLPHIPFVLRGHVANLLVHLCFAGAACSAVASSGNTCVAHLETVVDVMATLVAQSRSSSAGASLETSMTSVTNGLAPITASGMPVGDDYTAQLQSLSTPAYVPHSPPLTPFHTPRILAGVVRGSAFSSQSVLASASQLQQLENSAHLARVAKLASLGETPPYVDASAANAAAPPAAAAAPRSAPPPILIAITPRIVVASGLERLALLIAAGKEHARAAAVAALQRALPKLSFAHLEQLVVFAAGIVLEVTLERHQIPGAVRNISSGGHHHRHQTAASATGAAAQPADHIVEAFLQSFEALQLTSDVSGDGSGYTLGNESLAGDVPYSTTVPVFATTRPREVACRRASRLGFISSTFPQALAMLTSDAVVNAQPANINSPDTPDSSRFANATPQGLDSPTAAQISLIDSVVTHCIVPLAVARGAPGAVRVAATRCIPKLLSCRAVTENVAAHELLVDAMSIIAASLLFPEELLRQYLPTRGASSSVFLFPIGSEFDDYVHLLEICRPSVLHRKLAASRAPPAAAAAAAAAGSTAAAPTTESAAPADFGATPPPSIVASHRASAEDLTQQQQQQQQQAGRPNVPPSPPRGSSSDAVCFASEHNLAELMSILSAAYDPITASLYALLQSRDKLGPGVRGRGGVAESTADDRDDGRCDPSALAVDEFALPRSSISVVVALLLRAANLCLLLDACPKLGASAAFAQVAQRPGYVSFRHLLRHSINMAYHCLFWLAANEHGALIGGEPPRSPSEFTPYQQHLFQYSVALFACLSAKAIASPSTHAVEGPLSNTACGRSGSPSNAPPTPTSGGSTGSNTGPSGGSSVTSSSQAAGAAHHQLSLCVAFWVDAMLKCVAPLQADAQHQSHHYHQDLAHMSAVASAKAVWAVARTPQLFQAIVLTLSPNVDPAVIAAARRYLEAFQLLEMSGVGGTSAPTSANVSFGSGGGVAAESRMLHV